MSALDDLSQLQHPAEVAFRQLLPEGTLLQWTATHTRSAYTWRKWLWSSLGSLVWLGVGISCSYGLSVYWKWSGNSDTLWTNLGIVTMVALFIVLPTLMGIVFLFKSWRYHVKQPLQTLSGASRNFLFVYRPDSGVMVYGLARMPDLKPRRYSKTAISVGYPYPFFTRFKRWITVLEEIDGNEQSIAPLLRLQAAAKARGW